MKNMAEVGIRALKQNASAVVADAAAGEVITITENGKPRQYMIVGQGTNANGVMLTRCQAMDNGEIVTLNCGNCGTNNCAPVCPPVRCEPVKPCPPPVVVKPAPCPPQVAKVEPLKPPVMEKVTPPPDSS